MASEYRGFVFSIIFIIIFAGLLSSVPADLEGQGEAPEIFTPVDPNLVIGFADYESWNMTDLNPYGNYQYAGFNGRDWSYSYYAGTMTLGAKILYIGFLWFGQLDSCEFISNGGINRGAYLNNEEIDADASNGTVRYDLRYLVNGNDAGMFVVYWNSTLYENVLDAMLVDEVSFFHGVGIVSTARADIGALLVGLLLLQLPNCPPLINLLLATPLYASVVFLIWFVIKESLPFV